MEEPFHHSCCLLLSFPSFFYLLSFSLRRTLGREKNCCKNCSFFNRIMVLFYITGKRLECIGTNNRYIWPVERMNGAVRCLRGNWNRDIGIIPREGRQDEGKGDLI